MLFYIIGWRRLNNDAKDMVSFVFKKCLVVMPIDNFIQLRIFSNHVFAIFDVRGDVDVHFGMVLPFWWSTLHVACRVCFLCACYGYLC